MFCESCGAKNDKGNSFCEKCGERLIPVEEKQEVEKTVRKEVKMDTKLKSSREIELLFEKEKYH